MPFPKPVDIHWHSIYFISSVPAQDRILKVNYLYPKKPKERRRKKKKEESKKTVISVWLSCTFLPLSLQNILPSFLEISFVHCHWRMTLLIYLKYLCWITTSRETHALAKAVQNNMPTKFILNGKLVRLCLQTWNGLFFTNYWHLQPHRSLLKLSISVNFCSNYCGNKCISCLI